MAPRIQTNCYVITPLPAGHPWIEQFCLYVLRVDIDGDRWFISDWPNSSPRRWLCKDGKWRMGIFDYDSKFSTLDDQLYTDKEWKEVEQLHEKFNNDRYYGEAEAISFAYNFAPQLKSYRDTVQDALELEYDQNSHVL